MRKFGGRPVPMFDLRGYQMVDQTIDQTVYENCKMACSSDI